MPKIHRVMAGETLTSIAMLHGFSSTDAIWKHPQNKALHTRWPQRNKPYIGDEVYIPDKVAKIVSLTAQARNGRIDAEYAFKKKVLKQYFSLLVEDEDGYPLANKRYSLAILLLDGTKQERSGQTLSDGVVKEILPANATQVELALWKTDNGMTKIERSIQLGSNLPVVDDSGPNWDESEDADMDELALDDEVDDEIDDGDDSLGEEDDVEDDTPEETLDEEEEDRIDA